MLVISVPDYLSFVDDALTGMVEIVTELGDEPAAATAARICPAPTPRTPC
ncbi:MAG: hypothetical protein M3Q22_15430 [Actinomycetota bacterium]|nr:hypothetical protein [Actinomycetota bacterium]